MRRIDTSPTSEPDVVASNAAVTASTSTAAGRIRDAFADYFVNTNIVALSLVMCTQFTC